MSFGYALKRFREERGLTPRELGKLADLDHAYIYRLEKNEKTAPSDKTVESLVRTLKLTPRRAEVLRLLVGKIVHTNLIDVFIEDEERSLEHLEPLALMSFRGKRPETYDDWRKKDDQLKELLEEEE
ncbi:MAG: helix-turn-helix domain-containing protein [Candidatus Thiodiazotropha sp. (ex Dulcina madagascariensis)]|nr:helix-turn-helix domain-containing protein [Candidatus Thiodiazotropha sp. (ex Dulcina madagascariensis)]